jgi:branched-subunit amino acid aminotransferase/4-amino-4-deoxychorismate lyase
LFLVSAGEVFTTPLAAGATDSVMRRLVLAVCRAEKIAVCECPLTRGMLTHCEEAFTVSVQGIVSLLGYGDYRYFNLMAVKLAERINDVRL